MDLDPKGNCPVDGKKLLALRKKRRLTRAKLAEKIKIPGQSTEFSDRQLSNLETGHSKTAHSQTFAAILEALGVKAEDISPDGPPLESSSSSVQTVVRGSDLPRLDLRKEIADWLQETPYAISPIDEYLPIYASYTGLDRSEVAVEPQGEYEPPKDLKAFMERFPSTGVINDLYSFRGWKDIPSPDEMDGARGKKLVLFAQGGTWAHVNTQTKIWNASQDPVSDPACLLFRKKYLAKLFPVNESPVFHNMNCQVAVITSDNQIIIARRKQGVVLAGHWTASLEEQMLRRRQKDGFSDHGDLFGCAERGARAELGITVLPGYPRLLGFGLEFGNFTAVLIFLIRCAENFAGVIQAWLHAEENDEAVALDALPAQSDEINWALASREWIPRTPRPSPLWNGPGDAAIADRWHPTAKARLWMCLRHIELSGSEKIPRRSISSTGLTKKDVIC